MAFDVGRDVIERDEPSDLGPERVVQICPLPSSLTWRDDGSRRFRRFTFDLESLGPAALPPIAIPTK
jgi:hypothetical protein